MKKTLVIKKAKGTSLDKVIGEFINGIKNDDEFKKDLNYIKEKEEELKKFIKEGKTKVSKNKNQLVVLRKWNSYTPVLPPKREDYSSKGGGYFIRFDKIGIVVDPGYNFIENFLKSGFKLDDIDYIFISHAHNDHTVELEGIFSLLYKRNKEEKIKKVKKVNLYMNLGAFKKFSGYFDLSKPDEKSFIENIIILNKHQVVRLNNKIDVFICQTQHHEMITKEYALGFVFSFTLSNNEKRIIKFTCDTGWNDEIEKKNKEKAEEFGFDAIDILVSHIGSIKEKELKYDGTKKMNKNKNSFYENHLGLIGTAASLHFWRPKVFLISEFGEEMNAIRDKIAKKIFDSFKIPTFATDLNFKIDFECLDVFCFKNKKFYNYKDIETRYDGKEQLYYLEKNSLSEVERKEKSILGTSIKPF